MRLYILKRQRFYFNLLCNSKRSRTMEERTEQNTTCVFLGARQGQKKKQVHEHRTAMKASSSSREHLLPLCFNSTLVKRIKAKKRRGGRKSEDSFKKKLTGNILLCLLLITCYV